MPRPKNKKSPGTVPAPQTTPAAPKGRQSRAPEPPQQGKARGKNRQKR